MITFLIGLVIMAAHQLAVWSVTSSLPFVSLFKEWYFLSIGIMIALYGTSKNLELSFIFTLVLTILLVFI